MHALGNFLLFSFLMCLGQIVHGSEIINGKKASDESMKYMVSVQNWERHLCGGFLISDDYVVTAAHCADKNKPDRIILGHDLNSKKRTQIRIEYHCKHPEYVDVARGNDIMLLKLAAKVPLGNRVRTIPLPQAVVNFKKNAKCTVAGWGGTETHPKGVDELRVVNVPIIDQKVCLKKWNIKLPHNVICAGGFGTKNGFCQGDSGGPLVCNETAVGVASFNSHENCKYPNVPNIYTDIFRYRSWINKNMKGNRCFN